jgi:hypothetical protein
MTGMSPDATHAATIAGVLIRSASLNFFRRFSAISETTDFVRFVFMPPLVIFISDEKPAQYGEIPTFDGENPPFAGRAEGISLA